jgi:hypothetical protein
VVPQIKISANQRCLHPRHTAREHESAFYQKKHFNFDDEDALILTWDMERTKNLKK